MTAPAGGAGRRLTDHLLSLVATFATAALALTLTGRLAPVDSHLSGPILYLVYIPSILLVVAALMVGVVYTWRGWPRPRIARVIVALTIMTGAGWALHREYPALLSANTRPASAPGGGLRVLMWNVQSYSQGRVRVVEAIRDAEADVVCLVEGTFGGHRPDAVARALGGDYDWAVGRRLSVATRLPLREAREVITNRSMSILRVVIGGEGGDFAVLLVDINPPARRGPGVLAELRAAIDMETLPHLVVGDFNTPRGSRGLERATAGLEDLVAAHAAGRWWATWPTRPYPMLQIDHAFAGGGLAVESLAIERTTLSDHARLVVTLGR